MIDAASGRKKLKEIVTHCLRGGDGASLVNSEISFCPSDRESFEEMC
jgi:hypothetical protein